MKSSPQSLMQVYFTHFLHISYFSGPKGVLSQKGRMPKCLKLSFHETQAMTYQSASSL